MPTVEANSQNSSNSVAAVKASEVNQKTWIIIRQLGEGAFGEVKLIVDSANANCCAAMKCVDLSKHSEIIDSLRKEALLQRMLRGHRNVIQYIGMRFEGQNEFQLFLEYAAGGELFDRIEPDKGMPKVNAQFYFRQLIDGIKYIHSKGIAHRDLKPENLLLSYNGQENLKLYRVDSCTSVVNHIRSLTLFVIELICRSCCFCII
ncbi:hypothetical protein AB6A40_008879 [Gnathostoma spinigerum]|uniref:non-specific serine/threonine protein kinase n=1 Tax=Gnathostoma spinigerum TaxID=75299 RepID=A0ABD6F0H4_9BILA